MPPSPRVQTGQIRWLSSATSNKRLIVFLKWLLASHRIPWLLHRPPTWLLLENRGAEELQVCVFVTTPKFPVEKLTLNVELFKKMWIIFSKRTASVWELTRWVRAPCNRPPWCSAACEQEQGWSIGHQRGVSHWRSCETLQGTDWSHHTDSSPALLSLHQAHL